MSEHNDPLEAFDRIPAPTHQEQPAEDLRPRAQQGRRPSHPWKPIVGVVVLLVLFALVLWRCSGSEDQSTPSPVGSASSTAASSVESSEASDSSTVDGYGPQAPTSTKNTESAHPVSLPAAKSPQVDTANSDSVMKAFVTAMNTRDSAQDINRVTGWVRDYNRIDDLESIDPYGQNGMMDGRAPARAIAVDLSRAGASQPASTSTRKARTAKVTVQSASGQKTVQEWDLVTGKDGDIWKITGVHLVSVTGKK